MSVNSAPEPVHEYALSVQVFDTDCFGVMWHGAYTKWLEKGRVDLLGACGIQLSTPEDAEGYIYPVVDQHFQFRSPARMRDELIVHTRIMAMADPRIVFFQEIRNGETGRLVIEATTTCVVCDMNWKPMRRIPAFLKEKLGYHSAIV